jgi:hypothetical protein
VHGSAAVVHRAFGRARSDIALDLFLSCRGSLSPSQLATLKSKAPKGDRWLYEIKYFNFIYLSETPAR